MRANPTAIAMDVPTAPKTDGAAATVSGQGVENIAVLAKLVPELHREYEHQESEKGEQDDPREGHGALP